MFTTLTVIVLCAATAFSQQVRALHEVEAELSAVSPDDAAARIHLLCERALLVSRVRPLDAVEVADLALASARVPSDPELLAHALNVRGSCLSRTSQFAAAREVFDEALEFAERAGDTATQSRIHYNLGTIHANADNPIGARASYARSLELSSEEGPTRFTGLLHSALGELALKANDREEARSWYERGLLDAKRSGDQGIEALHARHLALLDLQDGRYAAAEQGYRRSLALTRQGETREAVATSLIQLAEALARQGHLAEAETYGTEAHTIALDLDMPVLEKDVTRIMSFIYAEQGEFEEALEFQQRYTAASLLMETRMRDAELNRLTLTHERNNRAQELIIEQAEIRRQQYLLYAGRGGFVLLLLILAFVARSSKHKSQLNQKLAMQNRAINETNARVVHLNADLEHTLREVQRLSGLLPICCHCKSIRDDAGYWRQVESYITDHSEAEYSHGICPECIERHYDVEPV